MGSGAPFRLPDGHLRVEVGIVGGVRGWGDDLVGGILCTGGVQPVLEEHSLYLREAKRALVRRREAEEVGEYHLRHQEELAPPALGWRE